MEDAGANLAPDYAPSEGTEHLILFADGDTAASGAATRLLNFRMVVTDAEAHSGRAVSNPSADEVHGRLGGPCTLARVGYAHWLGLDLPGGMLQLSQLLFLCPEAAAAAKRDETPLRLISWLNYKLDLKLNRLID